MPFEAGRRHENRVRPPSRVLWARTDVSRAIRIAYSRWVTFTRRFLALLVAGLLSVALGEASTARQAEAPRATQALDHEPLLRVFLTEGSVVTVQLAEPARLTGAGPPREVGPGTLTARVHESGWRIDGSERLLSGPAVLSGTARRAGQAPFRVEALPRFGAKRSLQLAGDLVLQRVGQVVQVVERVPMEEYLASVVASEMSPKWPAGALAAQAIVARSYAAARWMERYDEPWHLHWHFGVDMAYHGWSERHESVARAIAPTRGEVLIFRGFPVLALFHASSGGRTEAFDRIKPGVFAPDGKTPIGTAMPVVDDAAALPGAAGLELSASHGNWKADIPLPEVTAALQAWSKEAAYRPQFGAVEAVSVEERHTDSGRVATVSIRHRLDGRERFQWMAATDFRLAVNPVRIRSLFWERCVVASKAPGYLVLEGRGFGHGCGLSQVSAWYLARRGDSPEAIVARFYAGAKIEKRY